MIRRTVSQPLTEPVSLDEYMRVLTDRQAAWLADHPCPADTEPWAWRGLPEHYVLPEDEGLVHLPVEGAAR